MTATSSPPAEYHEFIESQDVRPAPSHREPMASDCISTADVVHNGKEPPQNSPVEQCDSEPRANYGVASRAR